jgi:hypothetical protein
LQLGNTTRPPVPTAQSIISAVANSGELNKYFQIFTPPFKGTSKSFYPVVAYSCMKENMALVEFGFLSAVLWKIAN